MARVTRRKLIGSSAAALLPSLGSVFSPAESSQLSSSTVPLAIRQRPFAIEHFTGLMLPDGIFDVALHFLDIGFHVTNISDKPLRWFWVRPAKVATEWAYIANNEINHGPVPPGGSVFVQWRANFEKCLPGKKVLKIEFGAQLEIQGLGGGFDGITEVPIFVTRTSYDQQAKRYKCEVPEGELLLQFVERSYVPPISVVVPDVEGVPHPILLPATAFPIKIDALVIPRAGYEDVLPFIDPVWWKVVAWVVAVVSGIAAILAEMSGQGVVSVGIGGEDHGNPQDYDYCVPDPSAHPNKDTLAGFLSMVCTGAIRVGMMDQKDPWQKGRETFPLRAADPRVSERVMARITPPPTIAAGSKYDVPIEWTYTAERRSGAVDNVSRQEVGTAENVLSRVDIDVPKRVSRNGVIRIRVRLELSKGRFAKGADIYGFAIFVSPAPRRQPFRVQLADVGIGGTRSVNSGWFIAELNLEGLLEQLSMQERLGNWLIHLYVQKTNDAGFDLLPLDAATHVGGDFLLGPVRLTAAKNTPANPKPHCAPDKQLSVLVV